MREHITYISLLFFIYFWVPSHSTWDLSFPQAGIKPAEHFPCSGNREP